MAACVTGKLSSANILLSHPIIQSANPYISNRKARLQAWKISSQVTNKQKESVGLMPLTGWSESFFLAFVRSSLESWLGQSRIRVWNHSSARVPLRRLLLLIHLSPYLSLIRSLSQGMESNQPPQGPTSNARVDVNRLRHMTSHVGHMCRTSPIHFPSTSSWKVWHLLFDITGKSRIGICLNKPTE